MLRGLIVVAAVALWIYCLVEVVQTDASKVRNLPKVAWVVILVLFGVFGAVGWLIAGRPKGARAAVGGVGRRPAPRQIAPDDDPEFLRGLGMLKPPPPVDPDEPPTRQV